MVASRPRRGPQLPYRVLAGVVSNGAAGWLVVTGKLQGVTLLPEGAVSLPSVLDVLDYRPSFDVIALHAPVGLPTKPTRGGRGCDREARALLGRPRSAAIISPPSRTSVAKTTYAAARRAEGGTMSSVQWAMMPRTSEVAREVGSYHQRTVFEVHPELSFFQLNDDVPMRWSKHTLEGRDERRQLLERKLPGVDRVLDDHPTGMKLTRLIDASAALWTARRIAARAITRVPQDPEWDDEGIRMEIVR